jgi:pilus assembly protein CpaE
MRGRAMSESLVETGQVFVKRVLEVPPTAYELMRLLNTIEPDLYLVDLDDGESTFETVGRIRERSKSTAIIAFGDRNHRAVETAVMAGVDAVIPFPVELPALMAAIDEAIHEKKGSPIENLYAFLPAKAGSGTSTIVVNTAARLAGDMGRKTLVIEGDLRSGVMDIMLGANRTGGIQHALERAGEMDSFEWENHLIRANGAEFLLTARDGGKAMPAWHHYHLLLNFAKPRYQMILVDLPELVNPATMEIVRRAAATFIVCTPELAPLRLAKLRCEETAAWGAPKDRIHVLLNRSHPGELGAEDLEKLIGHGVAGVFPNDYRTLREAMSEGAIPSLKSPFGRSILEFARHLTGVEAPKTTGLFKKLFG